MKPQCETVAECLEQLARVMREFGFTNMLDAIRSEYVHYYGERYDPGCVLYSPPQFDNPAAWSFAIAKLEDKPVFIGDTAFSLVSGRKYTAGMSSDKHYWWLNDIGESQHPIADSCHLSWTPHKQTVTLKVGDNEPVEVPVGIAVVPAFGDARGVFIQCKTPDDAEQFRKAMKPLVKE